MTATPLPERLTDLWRLGPSEVVAIVGAGGKTTLMETLARDYEAEGARAILTTTTRIRPPGPGERPLVTSPDLGSLLAALKTAGIGAAAGAGRQGRGASPGGGAATPGDPGPSPVVGVGIDSDGKVQGVPPDWVPALRDLPGVAAVLVEADGAAGRPLKAPASWEPVIPPCASLVVAVVGLDAQGVPLDDEHVHRPLLLADLLGLAAGQAVPPAALLQAGLGGYEQRAPAHAGFLLFLNKADLVPPAPALVEACASSGVEVWAGSLSARGGTGGLPGGGNGGARMRRIGAVDARPTALIPAAGLAERMGGPKVLARLGESTVLGRVVTAVRGSGVAREVVVVAGRDAAAVETALAGTAHVVLNPAAERGMASSLRVGLAAVRRPAGLLVLLGDQPFVRPATLRRIVRAASARPRAAAVGVAGPAGSPPRPPVLLHRSLLPQVLELRGDEGARNLLARYPCSSVGVPGSSEESFDVDRPEDLESARRFLVDGVWE